MNRNSRHTDDSWENDAVWKLLDQAPPATAGPRFVDDTVRSARLAGQTEAWWKRIFAPAPLTGLTAAVVFALAALVFAIPGIHKSAPQSQPVTPAPVAAAGIHSAQAERIQEIAETETLIAAADHLDDFSDNELVSLAGF